MKEQTGLVLRIEGKLMWVATADRQFLAVPAPEQLPRVGDTVQIPARRSSPWFHGRLAMIAAAVILFLLPFAMVNMAAPAPAAYLALDINPSVELALDQNGRVLAAEALNEDGATVLQGLALKNLPIAKAILPSCTGRRNWLLPPDTEHTLFRRYPQRKMKRPSCWKPGPSPHQICATVQSELAAAHLPVQVTGGQVRRSKGAGAAQAMSVNRYLAQTEPPNGA